jgi:hypothetical protein
LLSLATLPLCGFPARADRRIVLSGRVRVRILLAILFFAYTRQLSAASDKPDAPVPKPEALWNDQTAQPSAAPPTQANADKDKDKDKDAKDEVPKRIFFIIPNFMTANDQPENSGTLTTREKFNIAWHQYADYSAHFGNVLQAAISQAANGIPHYGQGWGPFGERFLAMEGDQFTGSMLIYGVFPTVLHQDPRYFRRGRGKYVTRIVYAATRVLVARTDSGRPTFNASSVFGQLGQAGISLSYYPPQDRDIKGLLQGWTVGQVYNIGWNQLKEFTPDLAAFIRRHQKSRAQKTAPPAAPASPGTPGAEI